LKIGRKLYKSRRVEAIQIEFCSKRWRAVWSAGQKKEPGEE
jgi:hypothetical protein